VDRAHGALEVALVEDDAVARSILSDERLDELDTGPGERRESAGGHGEIRVRRGLSYAPEAFVDARRGTGPFYATVQTKNETAAEVAGVIIDEMEKLATAPVDDAELRIGKATAVGQFYRSLESITGFVDELGVLAAHGIAPNELARRAERIDRVTAADVQQHAAAHLGAAEASIIIAGDAKTFLPALRSRFGDDILVIPIEELDLDSCCERAAGYAASSFR